MYSISEASTNNKYEEKMHIEARKTNYFLDIIKIGISAIMLGV